MFLDTRRFTRVVFATETKPWTANYSTHYVQHRFISYTSHGSIAGEDAPDTTTSNAVLRCAKFESDAVQVQVNYSGDMWMW